MRVLSLLGLMACGAASSPPPAPGVRAERPSVLTMSDTAFGPLTPGTRANLVALRAALVGYEVRPVNGAERELAADARRKKLPAPTLEYRVLDGSGTALFSIIPDDDGNIQLVDVTSPKVAVANHPWRAGDKLVDAGKLTACECRGAHPICWRHGEHVGVAFDRSCHGLRDARGRHRLEGAAIARVVWLPRGHEGFGGDAYGGGVDEPILDDPCGP